MTRRTWTVVIVVVAVIVAAAAGTALVAAAHHRREGLWPQSPAQRPERPARRPERAVRARLARRRLRDGTAANGQNGGGYRWGDDRSPPVRGGGGMMIRGGWQPLRGIPGSSSACSSEPA